MLNTRPVWAVLHIIAIVCVITSLLTGLRIAIMDYGFLLRFSYFLPQGEMHTLHFLVGFVFTGIFFTYSFILIRNRRAVILKGKKSKRPRRKVFNVYHRILDRALYAICIVSVSTGVTLFTDSSMLNTPFIMFLHFCAALAFLAYVVLHGGAYFIEFGVSVVRYMLYPIKKLNKHYAFYFIPLLALFAVLSYLVTETSRHTLWVKHIDDSEYIKIDGVANESLWQEAQQLTINTHGGANFDGGSTDINIRSLHNGHDIFFFIQWQDPTESFEHLPLVKTDQGWKVKENGFYQYDEKEFYEDKFAAIISKNCELGAASTAHLGPKPISNRPGNWSGKGYHYSETELVDLWHWKAVRTNNMRLMDDNYIGSPDIIREGNRRYTAGYQTDAHESGEYRLNWKWYTPNGVTPKRLPVDSNFLSPYQTSLSGQVRNSGAKKHVNWVIPWFDSAPYTLENDVYPIGTIMPSILYTSNKFEGDRAHVQAFAKWNEGQWSLEIFRRLDTKSNNDVAINSGVCMWFSAFDRAQISHTRHSLPIQVHLEP